MKYVILGDIPGMGKARFVRMRRGVREIEEEEGVRGWGDLSLGLLCSRDGHQGIKGGHVWGLLRWFGYGFG